MRRRLFLQTTGMATSLLALGEHARLAGESPKAKPIRSPFLENNFAPVPEEVTADRLKVVGKLPAELDGMYVRNGPNPQFEPLGPYHWFDGDGMLHGVHLREGKASYRNRWVRTEGWQEEHRAGKSLHGGLLTMPDFKKIAQGKDGYKNAANTALIWFNGQLLALWEGGTPHAIKVPELETRGRFTFGGQLKHACTAHPKIDPTTGEMMFFGYGPVKPHVQYSVADARGRIVRTTPIEIPRGVMMHDFAITARYSLFLDLPEIFDFQELLRSGKIMKFDARLGARVGIIPRHGKASEIKWFPIAPCYVFHTLNAHDEGEEVCLVACRMKEFSGDLSKTPLQQLPPRNELPLLHRWRFNMKTGKVKEEPLDDVTSEFPRFDERRLGQKIRYGYTMKLGMDGYLKYDLEKGTCATHRNGKGRYGGEAVFVPRPEGRTEDEGWLVSYIHDEGRGKSELVVIDAQEFTRPPIARVLLPVRVPFGFHGTWLPRKILDG